MPCMKCSNNKWKYGTHGKCQYDSEEKCKKAAKAIHAKQNQKPPTPISHKP